MTAPAPTPGRAEVLAALADVRDPELDEPVTDLGFVAAVDVRGARVDVALRLPTFFCAPAFAYLMAADAHAAVAALPGVAEVAVRLLDHAHDAEITDGIAGSRGFARTFDGLAAGDDLDGLRATFARKAYLARTHEVAAALRAAGHDDAGLAELTLAALPTGEATSRFLARRAEVGLPTEPSSPLLLDVWGEPVAAAEVAAHLRRARIVRVSMDGNASLCRGLLATRYATDGTGAAALRGSPSAADTTTREGSAA